MATSGWILFVDAHDSFSANIIALLRATTRADVVTIDIDHWIGHEAVASSMSGQSLLEEYVKGFNAIVIGPGPGHPQKSDDIGIIPEIWHWARIYQIPVLGICLGFQSLCVTYGLEIVRLPIPCHGQVKQILHCDEDIFGSIGLVLATQYNSLGVRLESLTDQQGSNSANSPCSNPGGDSSVSSTSQSPIISGTELSDELERLSNELRRLAWDDDGFLMAVRHNLLPFWGLQFHPESCRSNKACADILTRWWRATSEWNDEHRGSFLSLLPVVLDHLPSQAERAKDEHESLLRSMLQLVQPSGSKVYSRKVRISCNLEHISDVCRGMLQSNNEAMLESTRKGRWNIYAIPNEQTLHVEYHQGKCSISQLNGLQERFEMSISSAFECLERLTVLKRVSEGCESVPFWGGFIGFCSYEGALSVSDTHSNKHVTVPNFSFVWVDRSIVIDREERFIYVQSLRNNDDKWLQETSAVFDKHSSSISSQLLKDTKLSEALATAQISLPREAEYKAKIRTCQSELQAGNSYELCLTTEARIKLHNAAPLSLYKRLQHHNPVPYAAYLHLNRTRVLSSSPEQFLTWSRNIGEIDMVPMKGTVKRTPQTTLTDALTILSSPKESAENLMIADLIRHDLHRVVGPSGTVEVVKLCEVVEHETVYQLVSHIRATPPIDPTLSADERQQKTIHYGHKALRTTLPPGSMTGAPKKRSCEILAALEHRPRGVYSGVLGYMDVGGGGSFSVCIRTAFSSLDEDEGGCVTWRVGAGGAVTVLSDVDAEWEEMRTKLESVLGAFRV